MHDKRADDLAPATVDRRDGRYGRYGEVVLRRRGERRRNDGPHRTHQIHQAHRIHEIRQSPEIYEIYEIIANGCFLMDTSDGRSERLLVDAALAALPGDRAGPSVLVGGLGVGFSLVRAADEPRWGRITVVEREPAITEWHRMGPPAAFSGQALADPRVEIVEADLVDRMRRTCDSCDALCLDIDNGPGWTVTDGNSALYNTGGLAACRARLTPGGVLAVWSAQPSRAFEEALTEAGFAQVRTIETPVARGLPDVVHLAVNPA
jgi:spermidine synthase